MIKKLLDFLQKMLEKLDHYRDEFLFLFIKPYWPRKITPNHITWVRIIISVVLFVSLFFIGYDNKIFIISLLCVGIFTDMLDGSTARGLNKITEFGAILDPVADRLLILPIAVYALFAGQKWLLLTLFLAEVVYALTSIFYKTKIIYIESNVFGKMRMVLQSIVFVAILIVFPNAPPSIFIDILWISVIFIILSIFTMVIELNSKGHIQNKIVTKKYNIKKNENI